MIYEIATLGIDEEGTFWVIYLGDIPEQGGIHFGKGSLGCASLDGAVKFMQSNTKQHLKTYKKLIKDKSSGWKKK